MTLIHCFANDRCAWSHIIWQSENFSESHKNGLRSIFFVWIISWYAYLKVLVGDAARIYQRPLFSHQIYSIEYIFDGIFLDIFKLYLCCSHKTVVFTTFKNKIFKFFLSKNVRRPGHDCKAKFHVWCVTDCNVALSNILKHFGRNSPQNRLHWIFMRHAKKPLTKNSLTWKPQKKRRNRSYVYCFNMLSKIIIGSFGIEYQWLQWCQTAHICHNIRYLLMESMPYKSVFCKTHTKISKECLSFIGFVYYLFLLGKKIEYLWISFLLESRKHSKRFGNVRIFCIVCYFELILCFGCPHPNLILRLKMFQA